MLNRRNWRRHRRQMYRRTYIRWIYLTFTCLILSTAMCFIYLIRKMCSFCLCFYRRMSAEPPIFIQRAIIRQTKRVVQSLPIHHCHYRIIVVHRISVTHSHRYMCTLGRPQMWSICSPELSSLLPFLYQMKCEMTFYPAMKLPILLMQFQIQVHTTNRTHAFACIFE